MVFYQAYQSSGHCSLGMERTIIVEISKWQILIIGDTFYNRDFQKHALVIIPNEL